MFIFAMLIFSDLSFEKACLVACLERHEEVNKKTGAVETSYYSEHTWISSVPISINNMHEFLNLGARKKEAIEGFINTEKNRGYYYILQCRSLARLTGWYPSGSVS